MANATHLPAVSVKSRNVQYDSDRIVSRYTYETVTVVAKGDSATGKTIYEATPKAQQLLIETQKTIPRTGVLLVGLGGNNGTTVLAGLLANRMGLSWRTKNGTAKSNWYGSLLLSTTTRLGFSPTGEEVYVPLCQLLPTCDPNTLVVGGWDISSMRLGDAMRRACVLDLSLQDHLFDLMQSYKPFRAVFRPDFIAANQQQRADNILTGHLLSQLNAIRDDIRAFKSANQLDKVIVLWTATTERYTNLIEGVHDTADGLLQAIAVHHSEISPSTIYAVAAILEGCSYINGSPQNTFVPGVIELATRNDVFIGGDDFKSGQTKFKSVLVDFLISAGLKPRSIVSYNHLGNNDGYNLSSPPQFRAKEISKSNLVDDMIASNGLLYAPDEKVDHTVVIKYIPSVGDSKRAMDEYTSEIYMNGINTIVVHNTCEDSLLAAPLIVDMILLTELAERIRMGTIDNDVQEEGVVQMEKMHSILSLLSYMCKAPIVRPKTPIVNSLFEQRCCIINILKACIGLPPENYMLLDYKLKEW